MAYIIQHRLFLRQYHYIQNASQLWFNFSKGPLIRYVKEYGDDFCLVINCSRQRDDAYILPFKNFKDFFVPESMFDQRRWHGYIHLPTESIKLSPVEKGFERTAYEYNNAFHLLQHAPLPLPKPPDTEFV